MSLLLSYLIFSTDLGYLFYTLGYNPILTLFKLFPFSHWALFQVVSCVPWYVTIILCLILPSSLPFWQDKLFHAHHIYSPPPFIISHFSKDPRLLLWRLGQESKVWALGVLTVTDVPLLVGPAPRWSSAKYVHITNPCVHVHE